jgi:hypothetical protein
MDKDLIAVNPEYLRNEIERSGVVTLHGLQFYPDSAQMTPKPLELLGEVAAYLRQNPSQSFYIVGHTTTLGPHENLMALSLQRAESCTQALVRKLGFPPTGFFRQGSEDCLRWQVMRMPMPGQRIDGSNLFCVTRDRKCYQNTPKQTSWPGKEGYKITGYFFLLLL